MAKLTRSFEFEVKPLSPYNFKLTVKKPAGWSLFCPAEIYEDETLWTVTHIDDILVGIKLSSRGTIENPRVLVRVFLKKKPTRTEKERFKRLLAQAIGADQDLQEFYSVAMSDQILKHVIGDLYGMHDTFSPNIFSEAILAILLQMAPLRRSTAMMASFIDVYGDVADFDGKRMKAWPTSRRLAAVSIGELKRRCNMGYRAKSIVKLAKRLEAGDFPTVEQLKEMDPGKAKQRLLELPGIGDYSADIVNPQGGFPIDVWSVEVFGKLFFRKKPTDNRLAIRRVKEEGLKRWGKWAWMAFFYVVQDLGNLSQKLEIKLRLA
jgi:3-methyladenine DNA glycosylase/8-oxoguanine DNA glycosylase